MDSPRPRFPSLYNPRFELAPNRHVPIQPNGQYLENAGDVYLFTLYWTLILYAPLFLITGTCAALILALEPLRRIRTRASLASNGRAQSMLINAPRKRSIVYGAVVFFVYIIVGTWLAVFGSTVVGFLIAAVYESGKFKVSTWIPFIWALLQTLVALTGMCSLIIDII